MIKTYHKEKKEILNRKFLILNLISYLLNLLSRRKLMLIPIVVLLITLPILYLTFKYQKKTEAAWFNDNWQYRKAITLTNSTSAETNVYTSHTIDTSDTTRFQTDCGDIRFTKQNGQLLDYYVVSGCGTASTVIHVLHDTFPAGAQVIYMYYGNLTAENGFSSVDFSTVASSYSIDATGSEEKTPGPIAYWKLDEGYGPTASDQTQNDNDAAITSGTWVNEDQCISGKCLSFNGTNTVVTAPITTSNGLDYRGPFTWNLWFKRGDTSTFRTLMSRNDTCMSAELDGFMLAFRDAYNLVFHGVINGTDAFYIYYTNETLWNDTANWHMATAVWDGTTSINGVKIYIDGKVVVQGTSLYDASSFISLAGYNQRVGALFCDAHYFKGYMDEVKIYPYARSTAQIYADFAGRGTNKGAVATLGVDSSNTLSQGLAGYWKLDESSGTAFDSSGVDNTLTNNGTTTFTTAKFGNGSEHDPASSQFFSTTTAILGVKTVSFWVNPDSTTNYFIDLNGSAYISASSGTISATGFADAKIYVNGQISSTISADSWSFVTVTTDTEIDTTTFKIGNINTNYFDGTMDEVRLYARTLSPKEVRDLYGSAPGPVGYWKMDEGVWTNDCSTDTVFDSSGNSLHGDSCPSSTGPTGGAVGKYGKGGYFDGSNDYISIPDSDYIDFAYNQNFTISIWAKIPTTQINTTYTTNSLYGKWNGTSGPYSYVLRLQNQTHVNPGYLTVYRYDGTYNPGITSSKTYNDNQWHYITFLRKGSTLYLYVDGKYDNSVSDTTTGTTTNSSPLYIGYQANSTHYFNGYLDDLKIYNYARTSGQIIEDMNAGHPVVGSPVGSAVAYYKFDEGYGNTTNNYGSGGSILNLTNSGATWNNNGKYDKAFLFDGVNDYLYVGDDNSLDMRTNGFTASFWINASATNTHDFVVMKGATSSTDAGYSLSLSSSVGKPEIYISDGSSYIVNNLTGSKSVTDNTWHHVVFTWDPALGAKIYIDGQLDAQTNTTSTVNINSSSSLKIGGYTSSDYSVNGLIDEVKIYQTALTEDQVKQEYNQGKAIVLGALSTDATGAASNSTSASYCPPGNTEGNCATGLNPSPIGEWKMDEGVWTNDCSTDTVFDSSGNSLHGDSCPNSTGPTGGAVGKYGKAGYFDGTDDYVEVADNNILDLTNTLTLSSWVKSSSLSYDQAIACKGDRSGTNINYCLEIRTTGLVRFEAWNGSTFYYTESTTSLNVNNWYYIVATYNDSSDTVNIYINGVLDKTDSAFTYSLITDSYPLRIGNRKYSVANMQFSGYIDNVKLYDYIRTPAQVAWDYNRGAPMGWWKMDECQGGTIYDSSGNSYNGTWYGTGSGVTSVGTCTTSGTDWYYGAAGKFNSSLNFDGADDYISMSNDVIKVTGGSISFWIKTTGNPDSYDDGLVGSRSISDASTDWDIQVTLHASDVIEMQVQGTGGGLNSTTVFTDNKWHHIVATWHEGGATDTEKLYVDGVKQDEEYRSLPTESTANLIIAREGNSGYPRYFHGSLDDIRIYSYDLSLKQIKSLYNENSAVRFGPETGSQ